MTLIIASTVAREQVTWLWPGYLPMGKVVMLDGDPGLGKSTVLCDIAARLSAGKPLPNGKRHRPMGVLLLMLEDGIADTSVPRLAAAGADLSRVAFRDFYTGDPGTIYEGQRQLVRLPEDLQKLQTDIETIGAGFVVIDPIMSYLSDTINANNDQQVRQALNPLADLAQTTNSTILLVRHLNKASGTKSLYRGAGSMGFSGVSRVALLFGKHPDDETRRVLAISKTNFLQAPSLVLSLQDTGEGVARVQWEGTTHLTADTMLEQIAEEERTALAEAKEFLRQTIKSQPVPATEVQADARKIGISLDTLRRAQHALKVQSIKDSGSAVGRWLWYPPAGGWTPEREDTDTPYASVSSPSSVSSVSSIYTTKFIYIEGENSGEDTEDTEDTDCPPHGQLTKKGEDTEDGQDTEDTEGTECHPPAISSPVPAPLALQNGWTSCLNCNARAWMTQGLPQLCPRCLGSVAAADD